MSSENQTNRPDKGSYSDKFKTLIDLAFIAFCAGLSMFYLFTGNTTELEFREIVLPLLIFSAIGWLVYIILRLILKKPRKAAILSGIVMAVVTNAGMLYDKLGYVLVLIISTVFIAAVFVVVLRFLKPGVAAKIEYIAAGVLAGLILFNTIISVPQLIENKKLSGEAADKAASLEQIEIPAQYSSKQSDLSNIYIFIFDELAGSQCMDEVFGYDNTWFYNDMRELGFSVSDDCTNHEQFTMETLSGLFSLEYAFDYDTYGAFACRERFEDARFFHIMEDIDYDLYETEVSGFVDFEPRMQYGKNRKYHTTEDGSTTVEVIADRTLFGPAADALGIFPDTYKLYDEILTYYTLPESYTYENALTFTYICCPHAPFIYDINGSPVDKEHSMDWTDSKYFLEQYEYMCKRITQAMDGIVENDPDAVILVLSDHGVKANKHLWDGPQTTYEQSTDTFFAVYTGGRDDLGDISGLCGANVLRTVMNKEFGFELDMTAVPGN